MICAEQQIEEWNGWAERVVYLDESHFDSCTNHRRKAWLPHRTSGLNVQYVPRSGRFSIHVIGAICDDWSLPLIILPKHFDACAFTDILQGVYWPLLQERFPHTQFKFVLDNAPIHHSRVTQEWLSDVPEFESAFLFLPPYSNDLNPIEHVWARMKLHTRDDIYTSADQLSKAVLNQWNIVTQDQVFIRSLTHSMERRIRAVIVAEGGATRY